MNTEQSAHPSETSSMSQRRVMVVADHNGVRTGISAMLQQQPHVAVVAEACSGAEALEMFTVYQPDTVVMDVAIKDRKCADVCKDILSQLPDTRIVLVASYPEDERLAAALRAGAADYVLRRIGGDELAAIL